MKQASEVRLQELKLNQGAATLYACGTNLVALPCPVCVVSHSLDLELSDEPLYLLASIHLQLGLLYQRQDKLAAAEEQYRTSLRYFPRFVAALTALGQVRRPASGRRTVIITHGGKLLCLWRNLMSQARLAV